MDKFKKIAVLKASGLGDFIFSLPALTAIRETFPESEIVYLGRVWHKIFLLRRKSLIDRVVVIPPAYGVGTEEAYLNNQAELQKFFGKMQAEKFDLGLQLHGGGKHSNPFLLKLGAKFNIGTKTEDAVRLDKTIPYHYYQNEYLRWLEVVSLIGAKTANINPQIEARAEDLAEAKKALGKMNRKIIILHPGATDIRRRWLTDRFAKVGDYFAQKGFRIIVTGSGSEEKIVRAVVGQMKSPADNFFNKLSINGLTGLLSLSELVISNDTGLLHLADALGKKTVGIYWGINFINAAPVFREKNLCLGSWVINCPLCGEECVSLPVAQNTTCKHETSFVTKVDVKDVTRAAESLLKI